MQSQEHSTSGYKVKGRYRRALVRAQLLVLILLSSLALFAEPVKPIPEIKSYVLDQTSTLTAQQKDDLTSILKRIEDNHQSQVVLVIIDSTGPEAIEQYSIRL
ncbi:MAG TPA: hypothetical protein DEA96_06795, partial [Leptospiraceae bacterium]|nr:hypothetical protein [Leptospiraceae bacterium]